jgi:hypothetical protein
MFLPNDVVQDHDRVGATMTQKALVRGCETCSNKPVIRNGPSVDGPGNLAGERQGALNRNEGCGLMSAGQICERSFSTEYAAGSDGRAVFCFRPPDAFKKDERI